MSTHTPGESASALRRMERRAFIFLAVFLAPGLAVALVGGLGLIIWVYQMLAGPPGPPGL